MPVIRAAGRQHPALRLAVEVGAEPEQPGALGDHRHPGGGALADLGPQRGVGGQLGRVDLGEAAAGDQRVAAVGQVLVRHRVELDDLGAGRLQQLAVLGVAEGEGTPGRHRDAEGSEEQGRSCAACGARDSAGTSRPARCGEPRRYGARGRYGAAPGDTASDGAAGRGRRRVAPGRRRRGGTRAVRSGRAPSGRSASRRSRSRWRATSSRSRGSQSRTWAARSAAGTRPRWRDGACSSASAGSAPSTGTPRSVSASRRISSCRGEDTRFSTTPATWTRGVEAGEAVHGGGDGAAGAGGADDQHDGGGQQPGHVRGAGEVACGRARAVEQAHDAFDHADVGRAAAVPEQRRDQVLADQERVQVAAGSPGRGGVITGVDVVRADLVRRTPAGRGPAARPSGRWPRWSCRRPERVPAMTRRGWLTTRCPPGPCGRRPWGA